MDINITTKYNIGDEVYVADHFYDYIPLRTPFIITDVLITIDSHKRTIRYMVEQNGCVDSVPEEWIFDTYAECTKWCEKHNKSSYTLSIDKTK